MNIIKKTNLKVRATDILLKINYLPNYSTQRLLPT